MRNGTGRPLPRRCDRAEKAPATKGWVRVTIPLESIDHVARELMKLDAERGGAGARGD